MLIILIYYLNITRESQLKKDLKKLMFKRYLKKKNTENTNFRTKRNLPVSKFSNNSYPDAEKGEHGKEKRPVRWRNEFQLAFGGIETAGHSCSTVSNGGLI